MSNYNKAAKFYDYFYFYNDWVCKNSIQFLKNFIKDGSIILDVACGTGNLLNKPQEKNKTLELYGIDESPAMIKQAKNKSQNIKYEIAEAENLPFQNNFFDFDLITITGSLYCFREKEAVISECERV